MIDEENDEVCVGKGVEDMIKMKTLTQEKILRNLKTRYIQNLIYVRRPPLRCVLSHLHPHRHHPLSLSLSPRETHTH
jgi:hypothetical protein